MSAFSDISPIGVQTQKEARMHAAEEVLQRVASDKRFSVEHMAMLVAYFKLKIEGSYLAPAFHNNRSHELIDLIEEFYYQRYNPVMLQALGARSDVIDDPFFSSFSSEQSFQRLRRIFDGNIYYARTEFDNPGLYSRVREIFPSQNYALTITNIIDFAYETASQPAQATYHLRRLVRIVQSNLLSNVDQSVAFFQTRGTMYSHTFQREVFSLHTNADDIRRIKSPEEDFDPMNPESFDEFVKRFFRSIRR